MDQVSRLFSSQAAIDFPETSFTNTTVNEMVVDFLQYYQKIWWECRSTLTSYKNNYTHSEQIIFEKQLDSMITGLIYEMKTVPGNDMERIEWQNRLSPTIKQFATNVFQLKPDYIEYIESCGIIDAMKSFVRMARDFDPMISSDDIYQAGRNVITANLIQLLLGLPARLTPSIFAYSMLYPYTDNYLDDQSIPMETKVSFNKRFRHRLLGEEIQPANSHEVAISSLIRMIENEWNRQDYPQVYESLLSIHKGQTLSLDLVAPGVTPFERDILGISFEKGGTSVMTDGYLAAGTLSPEQARILFGFGAFTQLMDDMEDISLDISDQRASIFSVTASKWKLDELNNQFFIFGNKVIEDLNAFQGKDVPILSGLMSTCIEPMLINIVAQSTRYFNKSTLLEVEGHFPFRFSSLNRQRERLSRKKLNISGLLEVFLL